MRSKRLSAQRRQAAVCDDFEVDVWSAMLPAVRRYRRWLFDVQYEVDRALQHAAGYDRRALRAGAQDVLRPRAIRPGSTRFNVADPNNVYQSGHLLLTLSNPTALPISDVQNEDTLATPKTVVLSDDYTTGQAIVVDVHDPTNMTLLASVTGGDGHTNNCISTSSNPCAYDYTTGGTSNHSGNHAMDISDPTKPKLIPDWISVFGSNAPSQIHDITEIHTGLIATASDPVAFIDTTNPVKPALLFKLPQTPAETAPESGAAGSKRSHRTQCEVAAKRCRPVFPRTGLRASMMVAANYFKTTAARLYSYDTTNWQSTHRFNLTGSYTLEMGDADEGVAGGVTAVDSNGNPSDASVGFLGCATHWFEPHPNFNNGGLVALSGFAFGVRLLNVSPQGRLQQVGYFVPVGGAHGADTVGVHWLTDRYMATIDFSNGGLDIVEYTGPLPAQGSLPLMKPVRRSSLPRGSSSLR